VSKIAHAGFGSVAEPDFKCHFVRVFSVVLSAFFRVVFVTIPRLFSRPDWDRFSSVESTPLEQVIALFENLLCPRKIRVKIGSAQGRN
jgi:hypothetical protein